MILSDKEKQEIRDICTYHGDGGTSGYLLSEDKFEAIFSIIEQKVKEKLESVEKGVEELPKVFVDDIYKGSNLVRYTDVLVIIHKHKGE